MTLGCRLSARVGWGLVRGLSGRSGLNVSIGLKYFRIVPTALDGDGKARIHQRFQRTRLCGQRATSQRRCYAKQALPVAAGSRGGSRGRVSTPSNSRRGRSRWRDTCPALSRTVSVGFKAQPWSGGFQVSDRMFHAVGAGKRRTPESWRFGQGLKRRASPGSPPDCGRQV